VTAAHRPTDCSSARRGSGGSTEHSVQYIGSTAANDGSRRRDAVAHEACPRTFDDSDGDGVGDTAAITGKVACFADPGADVVRLRPGDGSPDLDTGYDRSDGGAIGRDLGNTGDLEEPLPALYARGIAVREFRRRG